MGKAKGRKKKNAVRIGGWAKLLVGFRLRRLLFNCNCGGGCWVLLCQRRPVCRLGMWLVLSEVSVLLLLLIFCSLVLSVRCKFLLKIEIYCKKQRRLAKSWLKCLQSYTTLLHFGLWNFADFFKKLFFECSLSSIQNYQFLIFFINILF